ncbi:isoprenylcysteine carboxyl methyltransferase family protein [Ornithinimicrobium sp. Arc0846-15]|nr:isoprenylcysteine carboxyl methyltransferase family protein [Ornithinimicrobium laminariae]
MDSLSWFAVLLGLVVLERLLELILSKRHAAWALSQGGVEYGRGHYPPMVVLHTALLLAAFGEAWLSDRPFLPWLGWSMLVVVLAAQGLRWWCIATLGRQWNTRVIVVPGLRLVKRGPYRFLSHPNYLAVVAEGIALPLVHTSWLTALVFTALNAWLLTVRIRTEDAALASVR